MEQAAGKKRGKIAGPEDGREWIEMRKAEAMLGLGYKYGMTWAREHGLEIWQPGGRGGVALLLRSEVEEAAEIRRLHRRWKKQHDAFGGKRQTEKMAREDAERLFCNSEEAAAILGVPLSAVHRLVKKGRLYSYQGRPRTQGSRLWFSRRAVEQIREDPAWQARRERALRSVKSPALSVEGGKAKRERGEWLDKQGAFENRGWSAEPGQGGNWLNANEAATLMGVGIGRVHQWRRQKRMEGVKMGKTPGHGRWHYREAEIREWMAHPDYKMLRERWEKQGESERARREAEEQARARERRRVEAVERRRELGLGGHPSGSVWGGGVW